VAVLKLKKPISLIYERQEDMEFSTKRHPSKIYLEALVTKEGDIKQVNAEVAIDAGAYSGLSGVVLQRAMLAASGAYYFSNMKVSGDVFKTNTVPTGAFRGFGAPQMIFAVEMFMNHIAKSLELDPIEFRKKHLAKQGDTTSTSGSFRDLIIMPEMIEKVMEISDYDRKIKDYGNIDNAINFKQSDQYKSNKKNIEGFSKGDVYKGVGMSWYLHGCGFTGSGEQKHIKAVVRLKKDENDLVTILIASVDMGQGIKTTIRKLVAHELDIPISQVIFENPDTDLVPDSGPTVASRTIMIVGGLVLEAAKSLQEIWISGKEQLIEKHYKQPEYVKWDDEKLHGDAYPAYSWGVTVVEVEVSKITYQVRLKGVWSVYDIGKAIDEKIIIGQSDGGILQGIGYGMLEVMNHKNGKIQQKNVTDYIIPTAKDSVFMETHLIDNPFAFGPYGAKGAGELTLIGGAPAVALAIENAIGKKVMKIPVTPEYIMELMENE
jgi:CO/xanthine dehydrogenase Mo-binding subunit